MSRFWIGGSVGMRPLQFPAGVHENYRFIWLIGADSGWVAFTLTFAVPTSADGFWWWQNVIFETNSLGWGQIGGWSGELPFWPKKPPFYA